MKSALVFFLTIAFLSGVSQAQNQPAQQNQIPPPPPPPPPPQVLTQPAQQPQTAPPPPQVQTQPAQQPQTQPQAPQVQTQPAQQTQTAPQPPQVQTQPAQQVQTPPPAPQVQTQPAQQVQTAPPPPKAPKTQQQQQSQNLPEDDTVPVDPAVIREKQAERLRESKFVLKDLLYGRANIPKSLIEKSKCVAVIPSVKKFAWAVGGTYGRGAMTCRVGDAYDGVWSAPAMYMIAGGNFGLQVGIQATDLVLLVMNERGADSLMRNKIKLGGDVSVAAGPLGRTFQASTDLGMRAEILSYSRTHGIFAGAAVDGSTLRPDADGNAVLYGEKTTIHDILRSGDVPIPTDAKPMIRLLEEASTVASAEQTKSPSK